MRKLHLLLPRQCIGGGVALQVNGAVRHQRHACLGNFRVVLHLQIGQVQFSLDGSDDLVAEVDGVADRLLLVAKIQKGQGSIARAERDGIALFDFLQRAP